MERVIERSRERSGERSSDQAVERSNERATEVSSDRAIYQAIEWSNERSTDRAIHGSNERTESIITRPPPSPESSPLDTPTIDQEKCFMLLLPAINLNDGGVTVTCKPGYTAKSQRRQGACDIPNPLQPEHNRPEEGPAATQTACYRPRRCLQTSHKRSLPKSCEFTYFEHVCKHVLITNDRKVTHTSTSVEFTTVCTRVCKACAHSIQPVPQTPWHAYAQVCIHTNTPVLTHIHIHAYKHICIYKHTRIHIGDACIGEGLHCGARGPPNPHMLPWGLRPPEPPASTARYMI